MKFTEASPLVHWFWVIIGMILFFLSLNVAAWLIVPIIIALVVNVVFSPIVDWFEGLGLPRLTAISIPFIILTILIIVSLPVVFQIFGTNDIQQVFGGYVTKTNQLIISFLDKTDDRFVFLEKYDLPQSYQNLFDNFIDKNLPGIAMNSALGVLKLFPFFILAPYLAFYILLDGRYFKKEIIRGVPNRYFEQSLKVFHRFGLQVARFLRGLFLESVCVGILATIGLYLLGVENFIILGFITGLFNAVPYIGPATAGLIAVVLSTSNIRETAPLIVFFEISPQLIPIFVVILYVLLRIIDDVVIIPLVMGESLQMHPVVVVVALFAGGELAGVLGLLLALPVLGVMHVTLKLLIPMLKIRLAPEGRIALEKYWEGPPV